MMTVTRARELVSSLIADATAAWLAYCDSVTEGTPHERPFPDPSAYVAGREILALPGADAAELMTLVFAGEIAEIFEENERRGNAAYHASVLGELMHRVVASKPPFSGDHLVRIFSGSLLQVALVPRLLTMAKAHVAKHGLSDALAAGLARARDFADSAKDVARIDALLSGRAR
jgi:hypothetical protein